jgi:hypothetical protein
MRDGLGLLLRTAPDPAELDDNHASHLNLRSTCRLTDERKAARARHRAPAGLTLRARTSNRSAPAVKTARLGDRDTRLRPRTYGDSRAGPDVDVIEEAGRLVVGETPVPTAGRSAGPASWTGPSPAISTRPGGPAFRSDATTGSTAWRSNTAAPGSQPGARRSVSLSLYIAEGLDDENLRARRDALASVHDALLNRPGQRNSTRVAGRSAARASPPRAAVKTTASQSLRVIRPRAVGRGGGGTAQGARHTRRGRSD